MTPQSELVADTVSFVPVVAQFFWNESWHTALCDVGTVHSGVSVMKASEYRVRARRCLAQAKFTSDFNEKARLLDLVSKWLVLAGRAERPTSARKQPLGEQTSGTSPSHQH